MAETESTARMSLLTPLKARKRPMPTNENIQPEDGKLTRTKMSLMRDHWEHKVEPETSSPTIRHRARDSPVVSQLQSQPSISSVQSSAVKSRQYVSGISSAVYAAQKELLKKHHAAKSRVEGVSGLGGGVSLWPAMDDMRLSKDDTKWLLVVCASLVAATVIVFFSCHGGHISKLEGYANQVSQFHTAQYTSNINDQDTFEQQLLSWHQNFIELQDAIHRDFDVTWSKSTIFEISFIILYVIGIITLLYFLIINMFSKQRLTPRIIKAWISLLCVVTVWTVLSVYLLVCAQRVEIATQGAVHQLSNEMATLVQSPLDLTKYHSILLYWRTRCLPPTTSGVLSIMGLLAVQDVSYYLQYYSLPVLTAICTPIVKIVMSLRKVYVH